MSTETTPATNPQPASPQPIQAAAAAVPPAAAAQAEVVPLPDCLVHVPITFLGCSYPLKGYHAAASVTPDQVAVAAEQLNQAGFSLDTITGVDWLAEGQMEIVYDYFHPINGLRVVVRSRVPRIAAEIPTISKIYAGANWHERETHDFFGIQFSGHPDLTPFLLPEDATYHPLRKDFTS